MDIIERLMCFGLTRHEANIYMLLFAEGELNGYEVSKLTGISRSNTYNSLAGLVEKGAAYIIEGGAILYTPVSIEEFCNNKIRALEENKNVLIKNVPTRREETNGYITVKGEKHIKDKFRNMLVEAKERVYLDMSAEKLNEVMPELLELRDKGIKLVIITDSNFNLDGTKIYHDIKDPAQIRLIVDSKYVLTGEIGEELNSTCLYSSNNNLVKVFKDALINEMKLIEIMKG